MNKVYDAAERSSYLREFIFGANDGLVTTLALVAGLFAAGVSQSIIVVAGLIGLVGGSISMGLGNYISVKGQMEYYEAQVRREMHEIKVMPEIEREEIRQIYRKKGFRGALLEQVVATITSNKKRWLQIMLAEELGITETSFLNPLKAGLYIGTAFIIAGFVPILPFFIESSFNAVLLSIVLSTCFLFGVGAWKTRVTEKHWMKSGIESVIIGALATIAGYGVGFVLA